MQRGLLTSSWIRRGVQVAAVAAIVTGLFSSFYAVVLFYASDRAIAPYTCTQRVNTDNDVGEPRGSVLLPSGDPVRPEAHYTLVPFQLVCDWPRADGRGYQRTHIELGTPVVLLAFAGVSSGVLLLIARHRMADAA